MVNGVQLVENDLASLAHEKTMLVETSRGAELPPVLRNFWVASLLALAMMFVLREVTFRHFLGVRFTDLTEYTETFKLLHTAAFYRNPVTPSVAYPPFGAVLYAGLYSLGIPLGLYLGATIMWLVVLVWGVRRALALRGIAGWKATLFPLGILIASFPIAGLLQTGNIELFVWIFAACGLWLFLRGQNEAAAVLWALAAATKLYPIIFLVLLLPAKKYRAFAVGVAAFVGVSLLSMAWMGPSVGMAWHGSLQNVFGYQGHRVAQWNLHELAANHSAFGLAKFVATLSEFPLERLTLPYYALGAVVFAGAFFGRLAKMPVANQVLAVSVFMVMLPPVSYFYALVHLYAPWLMLVLLAVDAYRAGERIPGLKKTLWLFVPMFASFTLFTFPKVYLFGGLVQAMVLVVLFLFALIFPFEVPKYVTNIASREETVAS